VPKVGPAKGGAGKFARVTKDHGTGLLVLDLDHW
jgi:hypothetical protein